VKNRPPLAGLVWSAFYIPGVARRFATLHPGLLLLQRLRRVKQKVNGIRRLFQIGLPASLSAPALAKDEAGEGAFSHG
jgi:hypothetical protein